MVRRNLDNIEIVEPPLEEITKRRSYKRTCFTGCGCVVFLIIATAVALRIFIGPGPTTLKTLPPSFPKDIPIYDRDALETITFISGKYKNRGIEIAALFPKIILSPLLLKMEDNAKAPTDATTGTGIKNLWRVIITPVGDHRDTISIEWKNLDAEPDFIVSYYQNELIKQNYKIEVESEGKYVRQFSFSSESGVSGSLYAEKVAGSLFGTDRAILTINLPDKDNPATLPDLVR